MDEGQQGAVVLCSGHTCSNGFKILLWAPSGIPQPVSRITTRTYVAGTASRRSALTVEESTRGGGRAGKEPPRAWLRPPRRAPSPSNSLEPLLQVPPPPVEQSSPLAKDTLWWLMMAAAASPRSGSPPSSSTPHRSLSAARRVTSDDRRSRPRVLPMRPGGPGTPVAAVPVSLMAISISSSGPGSTPRL